MNTASSYLASSTPTTILVRVAKTPELSDAVAAVHNSTTSSVSSTSSASSAAPVITEVKAEQTAVELYPNMPHPVNENVLTLIPNDVAGFKIWCLLLHGVELAKAPRVKFQISPSADNVYERSKSIKRIAAEVLFGHFEKMAIALHNQYQYADIKPSKLRKYAEFVVEKNETYLITLPEPTAVLSTDTESDKIKHILVEGRDIPHLWDAYLDRGAFCGFDSTTKGALYDFNSTVGSKQIVMTWYGL